MHFENLAFEVKDELARLTLNRPKAANSFNIDLTREFLEVATICADDSAIRAVRSIVMTATMARKRQLIK